MVNGKVGAVCGVGNQSGGGVRALPATVNLLDVVNGTGQLDTTTTTPIAFDNIWCNGPGNTLVMDVSSLKLQNPPAFDASSFVAAVDMNVGSDGAHKILPTYFGGIQNLQSAGATDGNATVNIGAFETGTLAFSEALLSLNMPSSAHDAGVRPLAGTYVRPLLQGRTPQDIATDFNVSVETVRSHLKNAYAKAGATNRSAFVSLLTMLLL